MMNMDHLNICSSCVVVLLISMVNMDHLNICSSCVVVLLISRERGRERERFPT